MDTVSVEFFVLTDFFVFYICICGIFWEIDNRERKKRKELSVSQILFKEM